jgi:hypothetical protein
MLRKFFILAIAALTIPFSSLASGDKLESIGAFADQTASEALRKAVEEKGYKITLADGTAHCEVWFRKGLPTGAKKDISGAFYTEINDSAVLAVINFPKSFLDFRGQEVKAGAYTLRYALHPTDGNHMGISPYRDFLLLIPVTVDQNIDATYKFEELVKLSAKSLGGNHPAMMSLVLAEGAAGTAKLSENEHSHLVLTTKVKTAAGGDLPIAFVVKGQAEQ